MKFGRSLYTYMKLFNVNKFKRISVNDFKIDDDKKEWKYGWNKNNIGWWYCTDYDRKLYFRESWYMIDKEWYYFDYVAGDYSIRLGNPDFTGRIVVIGSKIDTKKIENTFNEMVK